MSTFRLAVGVLVTVIWAATWIVAILKSDYQGVGAVTPVMLLVVGWLFSQDALRLLRNGRGRERNGD